jgi:hypothetical protein
MYIDTNNIPLVILQVCIIVGTQLPAFIDFAHCVKLKMYFEVVIGCCAFTTSCLYHICEVLRIRILSMNDGQWHRLDNVFAITMMQCIVLYLTTDNYGYELSVNQQEKDEFVKWICMVVTLFCQEKGPWKIEYTIIPIVFATMIAIGRWILVPEIRPVIEKSKIWLGLFLTAVAIFFFVRGLDDDNDYMRINHMLWHLFIALALSAFHRAKIHKCEIEEKKLN